MSLRLWILTLPTILTATSIVSAEDPSHLYRYMLPPADLVPLDDLEETIAGRPAVAPVEAPRPAPPVEIVTTPVGAFNISCSLVIPTVEPTSPNAAPLQAVAVALQPVEAARP